MYSSAQFSTMDNSTLWGGYEYQRDPPMPSQEDTEYGDYTNNGATRTYPSVYAHRGGMSQSHFQAPGTNGGYPTYFENNTYAIYAPHHHYEPQDERMHLAASQVDIVSNMWSGSTDAGTADRMGLSYSNLAHQIAPTPQYYDQPSQTVQTTPLGWSPFPLETGVHQLDIPQYNPEIIAVNTQVARVAVCEPPFNDTSPNSSTAWSDDLTTPSRLDVSSFTWSTSTAILPRFPLDHYHGDSNLASICPASEGHNRCSCETRSLDDLIYHTPFEPHLGPKPRRVEFKQGKGVCRQKTLAHFPLEHQEIRRLVLWVLSHPDDKETLKHLVDKADGKYKCYGCPNASFASSSKVQDHLRGQFNIRNFECEICGIKCIRKDDLNNHKKGGCPGHPPADDKKNIVDSMGTFPTPSTPKYHTRFIPNHISG